MHVALAMATTAAAAGAGAQQALGATRISARLTTKAVEQAALHGKRRGDGDWDTKTDVGHLPCAGRHHLRVVTRFAGAAPNIHTTYSMRVGRPRVRSGRARCGRPIPKRYGNRDVAIRLRPRGSPEVVRVAMTGRRMWHGGPFRLRLSFPALVCAGRYSIHIRMDGPRAPLRIRYRARIGNPSVDGGGGCES